MNKILHQLLCFFGFHKKQKVERTGEVNWVAITVEITCCKHCNKIL